MIQREAVAVDGLTMSYGDTCVVDDVTFSLPAGRLVGIIGPNGAGKSTLIKGIVGAKKPDSGQVRLFGERSTKGHPGVTYVPQRGDVDWDFPITALQVVRQGRFRSTGLLGRFDNEDKEAVRQAMQSVEVTNLAHAQIGELSGGQQQRVFLARALAQGGELFVMDEPFAGVDASTESAIVDVLGQLSAEGKTVLVVHHDLVTVREYFDHLILLNRKLIGCGPTEEVFDAEHLRQTYGGQIAFVSEASDDIIAASTSDDSVGDVERSG